MILLHLEDVPTKIGKIAMDICRIGVSFIGLVFGNPPKFFFGVGKNYGANGPQLCDANGDWGNCWRQAYSVNQIKSNQIKFISKCKNSAHRKHVMHLGGTARRIALTAAQCYSFIYK